MTMKRVFGICFVLMALLSLPIAAPNPQKNVKQVPTDSTYEDESVPTEHPDTTDTPDVKLNLESDLLKALYDMVEKSPKEDQLKEEKMLRELMTRVDTLIAEEKEETPSKNTKQHQVRSDSESSDYSDADEQDEDLREKTSTNIKKPSSGGIEGTKNDGKTNTKTVKGKGNTEPEEYENEDTKVEEQEESGETVEHNSGKMGPKQNSGKEENGKTGPEHKGTVNKQEELTGSSRSHVKDSGKKTGTGEKDQKKQGTGKGHGPYDNEEEPIESSLKNNKPGKTNTNQYDDTIESDINDKHVGKHEQTSEKSSQQQKGGNKGIGEPKHGETDSTKDENDGKKSSSGYDDDLTTLESEEASDHKYPTHRIPDSSLNVNSKKARKHFYHSTPFVLFLFCSIIAIFGVYFGYVSRRKIKAYFYRNMSNGRRMKDSKRSLEDAMPIFGNIKS